MKYNFALILILFFSIKSNAQCDRIDPLIQELNNTQLKIRTGYVWFPAMYSAPGDSLLKIGKPATQELINVLDDTSKGIIAHHILVTIWNEELTKAGWDTRSGFIGSFEKSIPQNIAELLIGGLEFNKTKSIAELKIHGLKVFMDEWHLFCYHEDLNKNKTAWTNFMKNQILP